MFNGSQAKRLGERNKLCHICGYSREHPQLNLTCTFICLGHYVKYSWHSMLKIEMLVFI